MIRHWRQIPSNELQTIVNKHDDLEAKNKALRTLLVRVLTLDPDQSRIPDRLLRDIQAEL
jgi:hypothetical protein